MKRTHKTEEWEIKEDEFYGLIKDLPLLHVEYVKKTNDKGVLLLDKDNNEQNVMETIEGEEKPKKEYELYGGAMGEPVKYKTYRAEENGKDVAKFCIVKTVQQELACGKCHIKINTDHHDKCVKCDATIRDIMEANTRFNDGCSKKKAEMGVKFQKEYIKWLEKHCVECEVDIEAVTNGTYQG